MPSTSLFSGIFCQGAVVARKLAERLGVNLFNDQDLVEEASRQFGKSPTQFQCAFARGGPLFERLTRRRQNALTCLKMVMAQKLMEDAPLVIQGLSGHLIPKDITHVLKVCLIADKAFRVKQALEHHGLPEKAARKAISKNYGQAATWTGHLFHKSPWDPELYDMVIPMDKKGVNEAVDFIAENLQKDILKPNMTSRQAVEDFRLAAEVEATLGRKGEDVSVAARKGSIFLTINRHVLRLSRFEEELKRLAMTLSDVREVETRVGPDFHKSDIYRDHALEKPSKIMLVDDEREFVETLSERLLLKDFDTAVVYGGQEALSLVDRDEPEVMVLDLKMPGIDGVEVLRRIKKEHPDVEVIILTGQSSKEDEETCLGLGAFAYLKKPVDVELLARTMQAAYRKIRQKKP